MACDSAPPLRRSSRECCENSPRPPLPDHGRVSRRSRSFPTILGKSPFRNKFVKLWNLSQFCNERELHFAPTIANATSTPVRHRFGRWYGYFGNLHDPPPHCSDFDEREGISGDEKRQTVGSRRSIKQCHHWWCRMRFMAALKEASLFNASPIHLMIRSPRSRRMTGQPSNAIRYVFRETVTQSANKNSIILTRGTRTSSLMIEGFEP